MFFCKKTHSEFVFFISGAILKEALIYYAESWSSGRRRRIGNAVYRKVPRVRIPRSPPFFLPKKMAERRRKPSLHCAVRHNFTQKTKFFLHIFTNSGSLACEVAPGFISLRRGKPFQSLVKWSAALPVKFSPFGSKVGVPF